MSCQVKNGYICGEGLYSLGPQVGPLLHWTTSASWYPKTLTQASMQTLMSCCVSIEHVNFVLFVCFVCIGHPTQAWFLIEYGPNWITVVFADGKPTFMPYKLVAQAYFIFTFKKLAI